MNARRASYIKLYNIQHANTPTVDLTPIPRHKMFRAKKKKKKIVTPRVK